MTREEFDSLYYEKAVHCDTEEKAKEFLALADSFGYKWRSGDSLIERSYYWAVHEKETCYEVKKDGVLFDSALCFNTHGYKIIEYQLQPKFKVGDKVKVNNTLKVGVIERVDSSRPLPYAVKIDGYSWLWFLTEGELEKVEEPAYEEETIDDIIEEIKEHQKSINVLLNRLERKAKVGK